MEEILQKITELWDRFTQHIHDGVDSQQISYTNLLNKPTIPAAVTLPSCTEIIPQPNFLASDVATRVLSDNTQVVLGQVWIPFAIVANKISFQVTAVGTSGTLKIALFSQSGQTRYFSETTATISAGGIVTQTLSAATSIPAGIHWIAVMSQSTASITGAFWSTISTNSIDQLNNTISGKVPVEGRITGQPASTMPNTFLAGSGTPDVAGANCTLIIRFDN